jgi:hypothetical protein
MHIALFNLSDNLKNSLLDTVERGDGSYDSTSLFWITYAFT